MAALEGIYTDSQGNQHVLPVQITEAGSLTVSVQAVYSDMVASGAGHAAGGAPDPGAVAGTRKFLCEDATWKPPVPVHTSAERNALTPAEGDQVYDTTLHALCIHNGTAWVTINTTPIGA